MFEDDCREIRNESGLFVVDRRGHLIRYFAINNMPAGPGTPPGGEKDEREEPFCVHIPRTFRKAVRHLHIPEGVCFIGEEDPFAAGKTERFENIRVEEDITFPGSLLSVGTYAFSSSSIRRLTFPPTLRRIGDGSFLCSRIDRIDIEKEVLQYRFRGVDRKELDGCPRNMLMFGGRCFKESWVLEANIIGEKLCRYDSGHPEYDFPPQTCPLTEEEWIHTLMPEAQVEKVLRNTSSDSGMHRGLAARMASERS